MKKNGMSTPELLITLTTFTVVFAAVMAVGQSSMKASSSTDFSIQQSSKARNVLSRLSSDLAPSNLSTLMIKNCGSECNGKKISFKIPISDSLPVAGSMYTPEGKIKFGAIDPSDGKGKQYCHYTYLVDSQKQQFVRNTVCDPSSKCGDGTCDGLPEETPTSCPIDCGYCGDNICSSVLGENVNNCFDCVVCGDGICSQGEDCHSCPAECGACPAVCPNGLCEAGESCVTCRVDCGACRCGDGVCQPGESCSSCPVDCGGCNAQ